jgi:hypothetical protein
MMRAAYSTDYSEHSLLQITLDKPNEIALIHPDDLAQAHLIEITGHDGNRLALIMPFVSAERAASDAGADKERDGE